MKKAMFKMLSLVFAVIFLFTTHSVDAKSIYQKEEILAVSAAMPITPSYKNKYATPTPEPTATAQPVGGVFIEDAIVPYGAFKGADIPSQTDERINLIPIIGVSFIAGIAILVIIRKTFIKSEVEIDENIDEILE